MNGDFDAVFPANAAQAEYWNSAPAQKWVTFQAELDARFAPLTDLLLERAGVAEGQGVVDIGCGTGTTTLRLAEAVGARGRVLGVDISRQLLAVAGERVARAGRGNVRLVQADAQTHGFEPGAHDLLVSRFGVMFFADPPAAFRNLLAALRPAAAAPAGRLAFVCWGPLALNPWFAVALQAAARRLGPLDPPPAPRTPGPLAFSDASYVEEILAAAGFADIAVEEVRTVLPGGRTAAEEAGFACNMGPAARLIRERGPDDGTLRALVADIAEGFRPYEGEAGLRMPAVVFHVAARRP